VVHIDQNNLKMYLNSDFSIFFSKMICSKRLLPDKLQIFMTHVFNCQRVVINTALLNHVVVISVEGTS
jgi:hypothetical protein